MRSTTGLVGDDEIASLDRDGSGESLFWNILRHQGAESLYSVGSSYCWDTPYYFLFSINGVLGAHREKDGVETSFGASRALISYLLRFILFISFTSTHVPFPSSFSNIFSHFPTRSIDRRLHNHLCVGIGAADHSSWSRTEQGLTRREGWCDIGSITYFRVSSIFPSSPTPLTHPSFFFMLLSISHLRCFILLISAMFLTFSALI